MNHSIPCPVCQVDLAVRPCQGRKSGKDFLMFVCPENGRHFRGFITDQGFMNQLLERVNSAEGAST